MSQPGKTEQLYTEFLYHYITQAIGSDDQVYIAEKVNVSAETVNRWRKGRKQPRTGNLQTIARLMFENRGGESQKSVETDFLSSELFFRRYEDGSVQLSDDPPAAARQFLIDTNRLNADGQVVSSSATPEPGSFRSRNDGTSGQRAATVSNNQHITSSHSSRDQTGGSLAHIAGGTIPNRLPDFVGQTEKIEEITHHISQGYHVLLAGMGGVGKTSLAIEISYLMRDQFPDGVYFVDSQGMNEHPLTSDEVARSLAQAVDPLTQTGKASGWLDVCRSVLSNRQCLLVLDNLWSADVIRDLNPPDPALILATARQRLAFSGGRLIDVDQMPITDAIALLDLILSDPGFGENSLEELAIECSALPLALRAAATYILVHKVPLRDYLERLRKERRESQGRKLTYLSNARVIDRSLDVEAVLSLSLEKLLEDDRMLAQRYLDLVHFPSDFEAEAVSAIWEVDANATEKSLDRLVAQSLVQRDHVTGRLRLHDLLKEMAEIHLVA